MRIEGDTYRPRPEAGHRHYCWGADVAEQDEELLVKKHLLNERSVRRHELQQVQSR